MKSRQLNHHSFTMPPTKVTGSTIALVNDTSGNLVQLTALDRWG
jgi:hypothetical protein